MTRRVSALLIVLAAATPAAHAQQGDLNELQLRGRQLFAQPCGLCHLHPVLGVKANPAALSKGTASGNDDVLRAFIVNGSERMPAFKYYLKPAEVDAIVAYLKTVPAPAEPASKGEGR